MAKEVCGPGNRINMMFDYQEKISPYNHLSYHISEHEISVKEETKIKQKVK